MYGVENAELLLQVAVDRDAGVEEAWIFFAGEEEEGGRVGEDGSTCSNVRFGIRMEGKDTSSWSHARLAMAGSERGTKADAVIVMVTCTVSGIKAPLMSDLSALSLDLNNT